MIILLIKPELYYLIGPKLPEGSFTVCKALNNAHVVHSYKDNFFS